MYTTSDLLLFLISMACIGFLVYLFSKKREHFTPPPSEILKNILGEHVLFYQRLNDKAKIEFENRINSFLKKTRITGVRTTVDDMDRVFIASAAIIPIFAFKNWEYTNIHEVLLYPDSFNEKFYLEGGDRNILGMVGNGPMQNVMVLSQQDLRGGFLNSSDRTNTAIHEFVHLIDKTDGDTDGMIRTLMPPAYTLPWLKRMHEEIELIKKGRSDINPYGTANEAEFLAVASEYFFEKPEMMQEKHPELYSMLEMIFTDVNK
jgi:Mlc titration factor MtfA (ptsG expression regulator)